MTNVMEVKKKMNKKLKIKRNTKKPVSWDTQTLSMVKHLMFSGYISFNKFQEKEKKNIKHKKDYI